MKKVLSLALLAAVLVPLVGCYCAPVKPPVGAAYSSFTAPLDHDYDNTNPGTKTGSAYSESVLGLVSWGDASTKAAAQDGNIDTITHADYNYFNVLGCYQKFETIVYGN